MTDTAGAALDWHKAAALDEAIADALAHEGPALVEIVSDPELV